MHDGFHVRLGVLVLACGVDPHVGVSLLVPPFAEVLVYIVLLG